MKLEVNLQDTEELVKAIDLLNGLLGNKAEKKAEPKAEKKVEPKAENKVELDELRELCASKVEAGVSKADIKTAISKYGKGLADVDESDYEELKKALEVL